MCKRLKKHLLNSSISVTSDSLDLKSDVTTEARGGGCGKRLNGKKSRLFSSSLFLSFSFHFLLPFLSHTYVKSHKHLRQKSCINSRIEHYSWNERGRASLDITLEHFTSSPPPPLNTPSSQHSGEIRLRLWCEVGNTGTHTHPKTV